jgi:hypothetical protein
MKDSQHVGEFAAEAMLAGQIQFLEQFAAQNPAYQAYCDRLELERSVSTQHALLLSRVESARQVAESLRKELMGFSDLDLARTIFESVRSTGRRAASVVIEILPFIALRDQAVAILRLAQKDCDVASAELSSFTRKNAAAIADMESKQRSFLEANSAAIQAEQDALIEHRKSQV